MGAGALLATCLLLIALVDARIVARSSVPRIVVPKGFCTGPESVSACLSMFEQAALVMSKVTAFSRSMSEG